MASFFGAFITLGVPVALTTYLLIGWLIHKGKISGVTNHKELDAHIKDLKKAKKDKKKQKGKNQEAEEETDFAFKKWLGFGAGFYGTAALYTYGYIEVGEILSFVFKMLNPDNWTFDITIELIVGFVINSIKNLISAFVWFFYWGDSEGFRIVFNFLFAYLGYVYGVRMANDHAHEAYGHPALWRWLKGQQAQWKAESTRDGADD